MLVKILIAMIACYIASRVVVGLIHWIDERQANKIRAARSGKSYDEIIEEARANQLWGWDKES